MPVNNTLKNFSKEKGEIRDIQIKPWNHEVNLNVCKTFNTYGSKRLVEINKMMIMYIKNAPLRNGEQFFRMFLRGKMKSFEKQFWIRVLST